MLQFSLEKSKSDFEVVRCFRSALQYLNKPEIHKVCFATYASRNDDLHCWYVACTRARQVLEIPPKLVALLEKMSQTSQFPASLESTTCHPESSAQHFSFWDPIVCLESNELINPERDCIEKCIIAPWRQELLRFSESESTSENYVRSCLFIDGVHVALEQEKCTLQCRNFFDSSALREESMSASNQGPESKHAYLPEREILSTATNSAYSIQEGKAMSWEDFEWGAMPSSSQLSDFPSCSYEELELAPAALSQNEENVHELPAGTEESNHVLDGSQRAISSAVATLVCDFEGKTLRWEDFEWETMRPCASTSSALCSFSSNSETIPCAGGSISGTAASSGDYSPKIAILPSASYDELFSSSMTELHVHSASFSANAGRQVDHGAPDSGSYDTNIDSVDWGTVFE